MSVLDCFLRYASIDTRSDEHSTTVPSTPGQLVLMRILAEELRAIGLEDVTLDTNGYLMATVPATAGHPVPVIGLVAHVDTSPEMPADQVRPLVHERYDGRDLVLPDDPTAVLRASEIPELAAQLGHDIVTASGLTLLGADDKAGVAEIVTAADYLMRHPEIPHERSGLPSRRTRRSGAAPITSTSRGSARCARTPSTADRAASSRTRASRRMR